MTTVDTSAAGINYAIHGLRSVACDDVGDEALEIAAATLRALAAERDAARHEAYEIRLTIMGGEDAPGFAGSLSLTAIKDLHWQNAAQARERAESAEADRDRLAAENARLREALRNLVRINEEHNEAIGRVMGKPAGWKDAYLAEARAALTGGKDNG